MIFTHNATHSINLVLHGVLHQNDVVVTSPYEHNSVMRVLNFLQEHKNIKIKKLKIDRFGHIDIDDAKHTLSGAKLLCMQHANNVSGAIFPIKELFDLAKSEGVLIMCDCAQSIGIVPLDIQNIDFLCASGHKGLFGIQGTGVLSIHPGIEISTITPLIQGGTGSKSELEFQPIFLPDMLESGTQNSHGIATLGAGVEFISEFGVQNILSHEQKLRQILLQGLQKLADIEILQTPPEYESIANLSVVCKSNCIEKNVSNLAKKLDELGILTRASLHCNPATHKFYRTFPSGALRLSPGLFNTEKEMEDVCDAIKKVVK